MLECVSLAGFSVMINGFPHGFFPPQRGLRQGDPLSPFLFAIVGEALSMMIDIAGEASLIDGFKPVLTVPRITHLQFADDTIIFCGAKEEQVKNVVAILRCFEAVSGLKVNLAKSSLIGIATEESTLDWLVDIMGCKVDSLPSCFLGLPLCQGTIPKSLWNLVVERVEFKLASWRAKCLSLARRVTLIKSVLANLPIYFMSLFKCPMSIVNRIEKLERDF